MGAALVKISPAVAVEGRRAAIDGGRAIGIEGRKPPKGGLEGDNSNRVAKPRRIYLGVQTQ